MFKFKRQWEKRLWLEGDLRTFNRFALFPTRLTEKIERGDVRYVRKVWLKWVTVTQVFCVAKIIYPKGPRWWWSTYSVVLKKKD
jgi:hypothetical protein